MTHELRWEPHGAYIVYSGFVDPGDYLASFEELCRDDRIRRARYILIDTMAMEGSYASDDDRAMASAQLAAMWTTHPGKLRMYVATTSERVKDAVRVMGKLIASDVPIMIFPTLALARQALKDADLL